MAVTLSIGERVSGGGRIVDDAVNTQQTISPGVTPAPSQVFNLSFGTASGQANQWYAAQRTVAATTADNLDLSGVLVNPVSGTVTLTAVKRVLVQIVSPNGTKSLRVGPQNVSNAWQGPWGGTGATVYETVYESFDIKNQFGGWAVTAGTGDILGIYNPSLTSVTYFIWIIGVQ